MNERELGRDSSRPSVKNTPRHSYGRVRPAITLTDEAPVKIPIWYKALVFLSFGGRDGIRTHDLLIANEEKSKLRCGVSIT